MNAGDKITHIRNATLQDATAVEQLHLDAFGPAEGPVAAELAIDLLTGASAESTSVFLAEEVRPEVASRIVGCVIFSFVQLSGLEHVRGAILSPLAVETSRQRTGTGRSLVEHGLETMRNQGMDLVLVYGSPRYYTRFGFGFHHHIAAPYPLQHPDGWMALELTPRILSSARGIATCVSSLQKPCCW